MSRGSLLVRSIVVLRVADALYRGGDGETARVVVQSFLDSITDDREGRPAMAEADDLIRRWLED